MYRFLTILNLSFVAVTILFLQANNQAEADSKTNFVWNGVWFTCEFSNRTKAPDDGCYMFDNEGFRVSDGIFTYLEVINSTEKNCRGNKTGHCFKSDALGLKAKKRKIGEFVIGSNWVEVDYLSCTQRFWFEEFETYWHGWPDDKKCFWTRKKEFFVKRYNGELTIN